MVSQALDIEARTAMRGAWSDVHHTVPTLAALQLAQAVGRHEGTYGYGWGAPGAGKHNWGAVHARLPKSDGTCLPDSFLWESEFNPKTQKRYAVCMRAYATSREGAADVLRQLSKPVRPLSWTALQTGDPLRLAAAMYRERYYMGFFEHDTTHNPDGSVTWGTNDRRNIEAYTRALETAVAGMAGNLGEPIAAKRKGQPAVKPTSSGAPLAGLALLAAFAGWRLL